MKMPMSEMLDRYTITQIRSERTERDVSEELSLYKKALSTHNSSTYATFLKKLYDANLDLWKVEEKINETINQIEPDYNAVGNFAMRARHINRERNEIKEEISRFFDETSLNYGKVKYGLLS